MRVNIDFVACLQTTFSFSICVWFISNACLTWVWKQLQHHKNISCWFILLPVIVKCVHALTAETCHWQMRLCFIVLQAQLRMKGAGLGTKGSNYTLSASDTYKDAVRKAMFARFTEIEWKYIICHAWEMSAIYFWKFCVEDMLLEGVHM